MLARNGILIVCSDAGCSQTLSAILNGWGLEAKIVSTLEAAHEVIKQLPPSLVIAEDTLSDGGFQRLLALLPASKPPTRVLVLLRDHNQYSEAFRAGAFGVIPLPFQRSDVQWALIQALRIKPSFSSNGGARNNVSASDQVPSQDTANQ